ncbi:MAG: hypothetical protein KGI08_00215 [Thaumarchaeota archaeon]|nr:hypothetical protein [Nitrososphaerota archaeon]
MYNETTKSSGYYFTRFKESIGGTFSDYSDPIPYAGYADNTVFSVKKRAIDSIEWSNDFKTKDGAVVTDEFLNEALWEGRREYHFSPGKRPFRKVFNASIGTISTGMYRVLAPSDLESPYTAENVYGVRIGSQQNMTYYDKKQWDADYQSIGHSTLTTAYTVGNQDLYVSNAREFDASGSVNIEGDVIAYSAVGFGSSSGGTLRISVAGTSSHAVNSDVWQGTNFSLPLRFTVFSESVPAEFNETGSVYIYFSCPLSSAYVNQDIFGDYYRKLVERDSDADILDEPQYDMFVPYLAWRIKKRKAKGSIGFDDPDFQLWTLKKSNALAKEFLGAEVRMRPDVGHLTTPSEWA